MRKFSIISIGVIIAASSAYFTEAQAQDGESFFSRDRNVSIKERSRPDYETDGLKWGAWTLNPKLDVGFEFNNNIFATATLPENDVIGVVAPFISIESNWSVHSLVLEGDYLRREYFDFSSESVDQYGIRADGRLDLKRNSTVATGASYRFQTEPRTSAGAANRSANPIKFDITSGYVTGNYETGRTQFTGTANLTSTNYNDALLNDGSIADQDFRDLEEFSVEGRAAYAISPSTALFARAELSDQNYDVVAENGNRNGQVYVLNTGADFDISNLIRGEVGLGYFEASFENPLFENVDGISVNAGLEWFPSPLITVGSQATRSIQAAALASSPAFVSTTISGVVDYEYRRNIIISAGLDFADESYEDIDRADQRLSGYIGGSYLLNRSVGISLNLVQSSLKSNGADRQSDFDSTIISFGITLKR